MRKFLSEIYRVLYIAAYDVESPESLLIELPEGKA